MIDTAECYGHSEELIGKALSGRRDDYYLFTKCGHASGLDYPDWDPVMLAQSIDRDLKRLQVDHVDVIHLHSRSEEILRRGEVIEVLRRAKEQGKRGTSATAAIRPMRSMPFKPACSTALKLR